MIENLKQSKRIIIKIGSSLLVNNKTRRLNRTWLEALVDDVEICHKRGQEVIIVSSGAIAMGRQVLELTKGILSLDESQAAAACGQVLLSQAYSLAFKERDLKIAQILLTLDDTEERRRFLNARNTMSKLLSLLVIPIINENDTVATNEIKYGDNDRLAARVCSMMEADCLVLLSDVDGFYDSDPNQNKDARIIPVIKKISDDIEKMAGGAGTELSRGGMKTKLEAAKIAQMSGAHMVITSGRKLHPIRELENGAKATWFPAIENSMIARKKWIAGGLVKGGEIVIDDGAIKALNGGKSLLSAGVVEIKGDFKKGDSVKIIDNSGVEIGRGIVEYDCNEARLITGKSTKDIEKILGYKGRDELIHRDYMVVGL